MRSMWFLFLIVALCECTDPQPLAAQQKHEPLAITSVNKPLEENQSPAGTEKFIILVREHIGPGDWDLMATAWEYIPSKPHLPLTKRCEFVKSHWSPDLLFREQPELAPDLIRLQVNKEGASGGYTVNLYQINYRTWDVRTLHQSEQIQDLGASTELVYLSTDKGLRFLNRQTGEIRIPDRPFKKLRDFGDAWLIRYEGENRLNAHLFDPEQCTSEARVLLPEFFEPNWTLIRLSEDHRFLAIYRETDLDLNVNGFGYPAEAKATEILIGDLKNDTWRSYPVCVYAIISISGVVPVVHIGFDFWFVDGNRMRYTTAATKGHRLMSYPPRDELGNLLKLVTVDLNTSQATSEPFDWKDMPIHEEKNPRWIPDYLAIDKTLPHEEHAPAHAFLKNQGLNYKVPISWDATTVAYSPDGRRFLLKMDKGSESEDFFYGDMMNKVLLRLKASTPALRKANDIRIICVKCR